MLEGWPASAPQGLPLRAGSLATGRQEGAQYRRKYLPGKRRPLGAGSFTFMTYEDVTPLAFFWRIAFVSPLPFLPLAPSWLLIGMANLFMDNTYQKEIYNFMDVPQFRQLRTNFRTSHVSPVPVPNKVRERLPLLSAWMIGRVSERCEGDRFHALR